MTSFPESAITRASVSCRSARFEPHLMRPSIHPDWLRHDLNSLALSVYDGRRGPVKVGVEIKGLFSDPDVSKQQ